jgi:mannose/cellobiose epimerase-like protein (N-acyl-D-glucosamine 2-epimerase family)
MRTDWMLPLAARYFDTAVVCGWDQRGGGLHYSVSPTGAVCDGAKAAWVQCEALAAAAHLGARTGEPRCWYWYERLWNYCVDHLIEDGGWRAVLDARNRPLPAAAGVADRCALLAVHQAALALAP